MLLKVALAISWWLRTHIFVLMCAGVRYLEKVRMSCRNLVLLCGVCGSLRKKGESTCYSIPQAVFNLDYGQLKLVFEALHERKRLLQNAPHLTDALPIMTVWSPDAPEFQS